MGRLSFSIALNLLTDGFKKGVNQAKSGFSEIQAKVMTFASALSIADFSLQGFTSQILDVVRATNRATTALQNVSKSTDDYYKSQKYLLDVSKKYGINVNDLTIAYAKFTAAANLSNMPMSQQQSLFESVSRATAAFALTSEDTQSVFLALSQMMGKGKIQAQELRLQMGEKLPVAIQAMAKAAGGSVGQMEKMMQNGELLSSKVLPKFGKALDELIPNVNTDHLETSINKLQNAKVQLFASAPISNAYKSFIDNLTSGVNNLTSSLQSSSVQSFFSSLTKGVSSVVSYIKSNVKSLAYTITALFAGIKVSQFLKSFGDFWQASDDAIVSKATSTHTKLRSLESGTTRFKKQIKTLETALNQASADERLAIEVQLSAKKKALAELEVSVEKTKNMARVADERAAAVQSGSIWASANAKIAAAASTLGLKLKAIWSTVGPMIYITIITEIIAKFVEWRQRIKEVDSIWSDYKRGAKEAVHTQEIEQLKSLQRGYNSVKGSVSEQGKYIAQINRLLGTQLTNESDINGVIQDRIKLLEATARVDYYTRKKLEATDRRSEIISKYGGGVSGVDAMNQKAAGASLSDAGLKVGGVKGYGLAAMGFASTFSKFVSGLMPGSQSPMGALADAKEYNILGKTISDATKEIDSATKYIVTNTPKEVAGATPDVAGGKKKKESDLQKAQEKYRGDLNELDTQLKLGYITNFDYNQKVRDLKQQILLQLKSSKDVKARNSELAQSLMSDLKKSPKPDNDLAVAQDSYTTELKKLQQKKSLGIITEGQYQTALLELKKKTLDETAVISNITDNGKEFVKKLKTEVDAETLTASMTNYKEGIDRLNSIKSSVGMTEENYKNAVNELIAKTIEEISSKENLTQADKDAISNLSKEGLNNIYHSPETTKPRDDTFDYRSTKEDVDIEITQDSLDKAKQILEDLKSSAAAKAKDLSKEISDAINDATSNVVGLDKKLRLQEVQKDVKNLQEELQKTSWDSIKTFASSSDQIVGAWSKLGDTLNSADTSGWEKIMAVWSALESSVEGILNIVDVVGKWTKASEAVEKSSESLRIAKAKEAGITIAANSQETASNLTASTISTTTSNINAANNKKDVAGNMASAGSAVVKNNAKIPVVGIALAAAGLIAILAIMGKLPKFAAGGIVGGGSTSGDNMLARVNSGEMILNGGQQKSLFDAINRGNFGSTSSVVTTSSVNIKGADMYLLLKNYLSRTGKKI